MRLRSKKFEKDGREGKLASPKVDFSSLTRQKEDTKYPVGPWAMAFFAFVILGSSIV